jgi:RNA polymerase sigma-70 factor (ECF subfamily)
MTSVTAPTPSVDVPVSSTFLIQRIARGDRQALAELYDRFVGLVSGLALRILHDPVEVDGVVLAVFLQVWRSADQYDSSRGAPQAWLAALARERTLDRLCRSHSLANSIALSKPLAAT